MNDKTLREAVARALCELHIRTIRRYDTPAEELEAILPAAVDYAWRDHLPQADVAIATVFEHLRSPSEEKIEAYFYAYGGSRYWSASYARKGGS